MLIFIPKYKNITMNNAFTLPCNNGLSCPRRGRGCTYAHCIEELNVACPKGDQCNFWGCKKWHAKWNCDYYIFQTNLGLQMNLMFSNMVVDAVYDSSSEEDVEKRRTEDLCPIGQGGVVRIQPVEYDCQSYEYTYSIDFEDSKYDSSSDEDEDEDDEEEEEEVNVNVPSLETQQYISSRWSQLSLWYEKNGFEKCQKGEYISNIVLSEIQA